MALLQVVSMCVRCGQGMPCDAACTLHVPQCSAAFVHLALGRLMLM